MAKRVSHAAATNAPKADVAETSRQSAAGANGTQVLVTRVGEEALGFRLETVSEIIRVPRLAYMPFAPQSLLGLANLRGSVLPVVSLGRLLGLPDTTHDEAARIVVMADGAPVGFAVDSVQALVDLPTAGIVSGSAGAGRMDPSVLDGVVKGAEGEATIKIISPRQILRGEFDRIGDRKSARATTAPNLPTAKAKTVVSQRKTSLVSFELGAQEYALPLDRVREIVAVPEAVSEIAGAESAVLGVITLRDRLLPLVSLRALLGLQPRSDAAARGKVIVVSLGSGSVGIVADRTREILRIDPNAIDPAPALLTRGAGDAEIESIGRLDGGKRLVAVLSPDRLFRSDLVQRVLADAGNDNTQIKVTDSGMNDEQFIIFRLGAQEYGLPISSVGEITRAPDQITRMPRAPAFIDGVINLRGKVLPIVDLRRRFELSQDTSIGNRRILVLAAGGAEAGFVVDAVSEVLKVPSEAIHPAPDLSAEQMRLVGRVVNLDSRMILLIEPGQLLTTSEASAMATLAGAGPTPS